MDHQYVFDRVLVSLGFVRQTELSLALKRTPKAAWNWRKKGFPKRVCAELQVLSGELGLPLPPEFYASTGIPAPSSFAPSARAAE